MSSPAGRLLVVFLHAIILALTASATSASVIIVTNTQDSGYASLRDNVAGASSGDTIGFNIPTSDPGYDQATGIFTITLTSGEIVIEKDLTISNASGTKIAISGNQASRILTITSAIVEISDLFFVNGKAKGADLGYSGSGGTGSGGAILNQGSLVCARCTFKDNSAVGGPGHFNGSCYGAMYTAGGDAQGGAITNLGTLSLLACTLANNSATGGDGGAGGCYPPFQYQAVGGKGLGGAIYSFSPNTLALALTNCTITGNTAASGRAYGAGVDAKGGGIANFGSLTIVHGTVANNLTDGGNNGSASSGGGLYCGDSSTAELSDVILARNNAIGDPGVIVTGPDVAGIVTSHGHNLLGRSDGCTGFTSDDLQGGTTDATSLDPKLGPLDDHGGFTQTLALLPDSPAIDAGTQVNASRDQRYFERTGPPDIGAFEYQGTEQVRLANISTRLRVQSGDNTVIGGFIIAGTVPKTVIVRGLGPSLPLVGELVDPMVEVHGANSELLAENDNWQDATSRWEIVGSGLPPINTLESALWGIINPGAYSVVLRGKNNGTGIALFEVYDLDQTVDTKLANVSTRGFVETGNDVMIGGTIVVGSAPRVVFRAIGPNLANFGVANFLADPVLELYGNNGELIATNDNWRDTQEAEIIATGIAPNYDAEATIVRDLTAGSYTAIVRGQADSTGVALIEVYDLN